MRGRPCSCAFTGHRPGKLPWGEDESDLRCIALKAKLRAAVESAIHEGMEHFICGMAEGCDLYFAETVLALKSLSARGSRTRHVPATATRGAFCPIGARAVSSGRTKFTKTAATAG